MQQQEEEEGAAVRSGTEGPGSDERLIGPRLPEPPKLDMEDESLNTTVSLIRSTLKKVKRVFFCLVSFSLIETFRLTVSEADVFSLSSGGICCRLQTSGEKSETTSPHLNVTYCNYLLIPLILVLLTHIVLHFQTDFYTSFFFFK